MGTLYVVATPIGNLEDVSLRTQRVLSEVSLIVAEDTRTTRKLLSKFDIHVKMISYYGRDKLFRDKSVLNELTENDVALVSEAGTPGFSDPGSSLIESVVEGGFSVSPIPGPNAVATLISVSGVPGDRFVFLGFLAKKKNERRNSLIEFINYKWPVIFYESPHRIISTLTMMMELEIKQKLVIGREMTKMFEEIVRLDPAEAITYFQKPRGEFTVLIPGSKPRKVKKIDA